MLSTTQSFKPITRQQLADQLGICTKTLTRFLEKESIEVEPRALLRPKLVSVIIQKYRGDWRMSDNVQLSLKIGIGF